MKIHEKRTISPDKRNLPKDAQYKGSRKVVIQDISIDLKNVEFTLDKYYSSEEGKVYEGELPPEYKEVAMVQEFVHLLSIFIMRGEQPKMLSTGF